MVGLAKDAETIRVRTLVPLAFRIGGEVVEIPAGELGHKPPYDGDVERRLEMMTQRTDYRPHYRPVCVVLRGERRYVWRHEVEVVA